MVKDWENGKYSPKADYRRLYSRALGVSEQELFGEVSELLPAAATGRGREMLRRGLDDVLCAGAMSAAALESWEEAALRYGEMAREEAPSKVAANLEDDLNDLRSALGRYRSVSTLRRLTHVVVQMSGLMCLALVKLDDRNGFRRWSRTARVAAGEVEDPVTRSWVLAQEAYGHFYTGDLAEAVVVARDALIAVGESVGAVLAAALKARALAALNPEQADQCRSALRRAKEILNALPQGGDKQLSLRLQRSAASFP
ncbi:hypothetical protein [Actinomadura sp. 3N407]|uniref:hypothetical protein n=1 Tax=Actinomadura sp. 3N407 TaxID=3457423 RepID=UPI003FCDE3C7